MLIKEKKQTLLSWSLLFIAVDIYIFIIFDIIFLVQ